MTVSGILRGLILRKANRQRVENILEKEHFSYSQKDVDAILCGNQKGDRYGSAVLQRKEGGQSNERFLKIMIDGQWRTYVPFERQVNVTKALHADISFKSPTLGVVAASLHRMLPYAIFETRENGNGFGYMNDKAEFYERFTEDEMRTLVNTIYRFHNAGSTINPRVFKYTRHLSSAKITYKYMMQRSLAKKIIHKPSGAPAFKTTAGAALASYLEIPDIGRRIDQMIDRQWKYVRASRTMGKRYLIHADMSVDNIYKRRDGSFELLDFEWVSDADNAIIPIMYDYGQLYARAWFSPAFQSMLEKTMRGVGEEFYKNKNIVDAGMALGLLRSVFIMNYFLDFENTLKKDHKTKEEYYEMYPKTLETVKKALQ